MRNPSVYNKSGRAYLWNVLGNFRFFGDSSSSLPSLLVFHIVRDFYLFSPFPTAKSNALCPVFCNRYADSKLWLVYKLSLPVGLFKMAAGKFFVFKNTSREHMRSSILFSLGISWVNRCGSDNMAARNKRHFKCVKTDCFNLSFTSFKRYLNHLRCYHIPEPNFKLTCPVETCFRSYSLLSSLTSHIRRIHRGELNFDNDLNDTLPQDVGC